MGWQVTLEQAEVRLEEVREARHDPERAHSLEDKLYEEVLEHHAALGCPIAATALMTRDIGFARWCA